MNKEIKQINQKIEIEQIKNRAFWSCWFFTNEGLNDFIKDSFDKKEIKKVFSIGGGGDFAFNLLSLLSNIEELDVCDVRLTANLTIDFKIALLKRFTLSEILKFFLDTKTNNKIYIYEKLREQLTSLTKEFFDCLVKSGESNNFLKCLKKSGFWYKESFRQVKYKEKYLFYLTDEEIFQLMQKNLDKINIYFGDFAHNLKLFQDNYFDLIYTSNIFDSKKYCENNVLALETIKNKLNKNGLLLVITQENPFKKESFFNNYGFELCKREINKFNPIIYILGHYCYSILLFKIKI